MEGSFSLRADPQAIELDSGLSLVAPGLAGKGTWLSTRAPGQVREFSGELTMLDRALAEAGLEDRHTLLIEAPTPPGASNPVRGIGSVADNELMLQVPGRVNEAQFVVYVDEAGIISFHFTEAEKPAQLPTRSVGAARQDQFRITLRSGKSYGQSTDRGLFGTLTAKVIKVIVVKLFPGQVGNFVARSIGVWEDKYRPQGVHGGSWQDLLGDSPKTLEGVSTLAGRKALLFVHGTTSTTAGAFGALKKFPWFLERLYKKYDGAVIGFNHHTMNTSVAENVRQFFSAMGTSQGEFTFDVISHSRGGLVARALSDLTDGQVSKTCGSAWQRPKGIKLNIDKVCFVATPNAGTDLALPKKIPIFVEGLINYLNFLPDSVTTIAASALMSIAGAIAEVGLPRIPGLADQAPSSDLLRTMSPPNGLEQRYFAFQADYEPVGNLLKAIENAAIDRIFNDVANDLVVPTAGVSFGNGLPANQVVAFAPQDGVHHTNFFGHERICEVARFLRC